MSEKQSKKRRRNQMGQSMRNPQPGQKNIQVKREDLKMLKCSNPDCTSSVFMQVFELGVYSKFINPTGQDQLIQVPKIICILCGNIPGQPEEPKKEGGESSLIVEH